MSVRGPAAGATSLPRRLSIVHRLAGRPVYWMFYLFVCSIPFEFSDRDAHDFPIEIPTAMGALFLATTLLQPRTSFGKLPRPGRWFLAYLYMFLVAAAISGRDHVATIINGADYWPEVLKMFFSLVELLLIFWVASNLMRSTAVTERALMALAFACVVRAAMPFLGIMTTIHTVETGGARLSALGQNSNHAAMILGAGLVALVGLTFGRYGRWSRRLVGVPLLGLLAVGVADTGSRGGILALGLGIMAFMLQGGSLGNRVRNMALAVFVIAGIAVAAYQSEVMRNRFADTLETGTLTGRERIYPAVVKMILDRPLFGWGPANNKYELGLRLDERFRRRRGTHNSVLEVLSATGIAAAIPFLIGTWLCLWAAWRARDGTDGTLPLALTVTVMASNMSGDWFITPLYWFALAYAVAARGHTAPAPAAPAAPLVRGATKFGAAVAPRRRIVTPASL
ncbi:MAG TPA: O-antigen ligase family protein [Gemmatimonadales bacterium]|nr:O-antigen ligase family protein [Gemmatimonadales bacterium]